MFTKEGAHSVEIVDAYMSDPKFPDGLEADDFDVAIHVRSTEDSAQEDWWRGEFSGRPGIGVVSDLTQAELTMQTLKRLGFEGAITDESLAGLVGVRTVAVTKASKDGKYMNVVKMGSTGNVPVKSDGAVAARRAARAAALLGGEAPAQAQSAKARPAATRPAPATDPANDPF